MIDLGIVRSTVKPNAVEIDDYSVYVNNNINTVQTTTDGEVTAEYEYNQVRYDKNEYIKIIADKNAALESQMINTQMAICEIYEGMV